VSIYIVAPRIATQTKGLLLRNFAARKGFISGMYLIPLFFKEGLGEILYRTALPKNPPQSPFKKGEEKTVLMWFSFFHQ
jgi:hypothetical protein